MRPQLAALFHCLMRNMRIVSEYHEAEKRIMETFAAAKNDTPSLYHHLLACLNKLPYKDVTSAAMTEFGNDVRELMIRQVEEHKLKKRNDSPSNIIYGTFTIKIALLVLKFSICDITSLALALNGSRIVTGIANNVADVGCLCFRDFAVASCPAFNS
ncbi:hypothetical protein EV1_023310 [Malus domestica]